MKTSKTLPTITLLLLLLLHLSQQFQLTLLQPQPLNKDQKQIFKDSQLQKQYNDTEYNRILTCMNGQLSIIQFQKSQTNTTIKLSYNDIKLSKQDIKISTLFNQPLPIVQSVNAVEGVINIKSGCLGEGTDKSNYFNKVDVQIGEGENGYGFSFLLGCDKGGRNKKFQIGYIVITMLNAAITIGVALHSRVWSIRYLGRPISLQLKWHRFLVMMLIILIIGIALYIYAADQFKNANLMLKYIGLIVAYVASFICADEILFLVRKFKKQLWKFVRICDVLSFAIATAMFAIGIFVDNWVYYDILAIGVCVGAIKVLRFSTMQQAYISMAISVVLVSIISSILHFLLNRSYNDYASELSSPLFLLIPDLVEQLYKKCSWLPTIDVIVPGVFLSFLRTYDENYNTGWGGVYTVTGNVSFILSTLLWVLLEAVYPYSIPFSLVTYVILALSIFLISYKRNQFKTLWTGRFNGANNEMTQNLLPQSQGTRQSFSKLVTSDIIDSIKYDKEYDSQIADPNQEHKAQQTQKQTQNKGQ